MNAEPEKVSATAARDGFLDSKLGRLKVLRAIMFVLHIGIPICVCLVCLFKTFIMSEPTTKIRVLCLSFLIFCLALWNLISKRRMTCIPYLILIAVGLAINRIMPLLIGFAIYTLMDDIIFGPMWRVSCERVRTQKAINDSFRGVNP